MDTSKPPNKQLFLSDLNHDVLHEIFETVIDETVGARGKVSRDKKSIQALAQTSKAMRELLIPELFKNVRIRGDWERALETTLAMERCDCMMANAQSFSSECASWKQFRAITLLIAPPVDLHLDSDKKMTPSPQDLPSELAGLLSTGVKLQRLTVVLPEHHTETFLHAFKDVGLTLPTVRTLILGPHMEWMVDVCPNIKTMSTRDYRWLHSNVDGGRKRRHSYDFIAAAGRASDLQHFEMIEWWRVEYLGALLAAAPHISSLAMTGANFHDGTRAFLFTLGKFPNLKTLTTAGAHDLGVGFEPPRCGNAYMGKGGAETRRRVDEQRRAANQSVARMVFSACSRLDTLWIGDRTKATVKRREDGVAADISIEAGQRDTPTDWPNS